jgi:surfactin synthase thioesterase subunit
MAAPQQQVPLINKWVHSFKIIPAESRVARLLCFHWAGGNGMIFRPWSQFLEAKGIEVKAVMLPGRLARVKEPVALDMATVVGEIFPA